MRLPRPRFTIRWLMVVVVAVALPLGIAAGLRSRARWCDAQARRHRAALASWGREAGTAYEMSERLPPDLAARYERGLSDPSLRRAVAQARYHRERADLYEDIARHPWLPVALGRDEPE